MISQEKQAMAVVDGGQRVIEEEEGLYIRGRPGMGGQSNIERDANDWKWTKDGQWNLTEDSDWVTEQHDNGAVPWIAIAMTKE
ncbi:hypothetical protein BHE74_00014644 [Ensete ventricosum]|uniref:Uncharacterized protein n=1 Tax=Ensete ventricosum TaxID=4639 RepID=A0A444DVU4_ENSVE|nr:hypothetical protein B296_00021071 [Ensete ventricosum]RWW02226.1 hypothetical protein GW17_00034692 [Ensete ventricosum]RWW77208.1 hypothetical protein BHE74_00014644 [Ensete ventricosum]RZR75598.1 hypothetical protein BHM03_00000011 [Ensete ventricosum]